jgi:hypothetical protein
VSLSINWASRVITVPQADTALVSGSLRELDIETFRLALKDIEDSEEGVAFPDTHQRNAPVTLSGTTYAQTFEIINGYTITFEATGSPWTVRVVGGNHNIGDVKNVNHVSLIIGNSAGLIAVSTSGSSGPTAAAIAAEVLAALQAVTIPVDVQKMNSADVIGVGSEADPWRGVGVSP